MPATTRSRPGPTELAVGSTVLVLGLLETIASGYDVLDVVLRLLVIVVPVAAAVALSRRLPGAALAVVWAVLVGHLLLGTAYLLTELAVAVVAFACARWGTPLTVVLSAVSIPVAASIGLVSQVVPLLPFNPAYVSGAELFLLMGAPGVGLLLGAAGGMTVLGLPWLVGLALRYQDRARDSEASQRIAQREAVESGQLAARAEQAAAQSREIAELREEQARLARDVHDVVGHSLAVILAQAEAAQYAGEHDTERLRATLATIATSARSSLQDVRQVLTPGERPAGGPSGLDALLAGVREGGHAVSASEVGTPQPLPPELETVAHRVLQEMLTNAVKHGRRGEPVHVERHWEGELRIEVSNTVDPEAVPSTTPGQGIDGMRRRLESVGGRLDVRRRETVAGVTFTATAWVPVRSR